ncbi:type II toxin-antitoxin system VapC family toxin [Candidatus Poriferisodalis sp.]|uniref:type II toxin-antitoxin system VapC family toxin n=1 Tax=Candidatus Poriferisodalis sp. TaxID=3101277 RepID=UPI003B51ED39
MIVDTSVLLAAFIRGQRMHERCKQLLLSRQQLVISPLVLAEVDYLAAQLAGADAELAVLSELASGAYELASFDRIDLVRARAVVERYRDLRLGLTDASLVVLAHRYETDGIATLDERHFRVVRSLAGRPFEVLPADRQGN